MGKSSNPTTGYWYKLLYHTGLTLGPIDAFLEFRGGDKTAWSGRLTASGTISINQPNLWGGEKDQGGIVSAVHVMFGEATQVPDPYLVANLGNQVAAWRGFTTLAFLGGYYGANNPYPQSAAYKVEKILQGWDDGCWYPEKAVLPLVPDYVLPADSTDWEYQSISYHANPGYEQLDIPTNGWSAGQAPFAGGSLLGNGNTDWPIKTILWAKRSVTLPSGPGAHRLRVMAENGCVVFVNGQIVGAVNRDNIQIDANQNNSFEFPLDAGATYALAVKGLDETDPPGGGTFLSVEVLKSGCNAINAAHALYYLRTHSTKGREPTANMNDASLTAAADTLYAEGFGICVTIDPSKESVVDVEKRICKLIGGSMTRSMVDGQYYLDLARGDYVLDDLPILTDDDILSFQEQPTTLDGAVNSVSVRYFDPVRKETIITPAVEALGLIDEFGLNHQVMEYPEIPTAVLAARIAERDLLSFITPTRLFDLTTTRKPYSWRPNTYFRLQSAKRGIVDMVCIVGDKQAGTLKSGAIHMQAVQDIYTLPEFGSVEVEGGVDTSPSQIPKSITLQRAVETPYLELVRAMPRPDLAALPADTGFLMAMAADPASSRGYTMTCDAGGGYVVAGNGMFSPTALVVEAAALVSPLPTEFTLASGAKLDEVAIGSAALWGDEVVRVDAIDVSAGTITLGRACGDTVPATHAAGERIWFYDGYRAADLTEYSDGEFVDVKLLTNTGSQQLDPFLATLMTVELASRFSRPYPPGNLQIDGSAWPAAVTGEFVVTWAHRDRTLQADQLLDTEATSVGPEETVRYALQLIDDATDAVLAEKLDIAGDTATVDLAASGNVRLVLYAISDLGESWQRHEHVFAFTAAGGTDSIDADTYAPSIIFHDGGEVTP